MPRRARLAPGRRPDRARGFPLASPGSRTVRRTRSPANPTPCGTAQRETEYAGQQSWHDAHAESRTPGGWGYYIAWTVGSASLGVGSLLQRPMPRVALAVVLLVVHVAWKMDFAKGNGEIVPWGAWDAARKAGHAQRVLKWTLHVPLCLTGRCAPSGARACSASRSASRQMTMCWRCTHRHRRTHMLDGH